MQVGAERFNPKVRSPINLDVVTGHSLHLGHTVQYLLSTIPVSPTLCSSPIQLEVIHDMPILILTIIKLGLDICGYQSAQT
jgi:hypothetical protein